MNSEALNLMVQLMTPLAVITVAVVGMRLWMGHLHAERDAKREAQLLEHAREEKRLAFEAEREKERLSEEQMRRYDQRERAKDSAAGRAAGAGSGGYIVVQMPGGQRPLFHDLLRGFEDYAKLKGYSLAFSIDASFEDRIAFKFTVRDDGFVVGPERVRKDFKEYLEQVHTGDVEAIDRLPVITSIEEHELLVTLLKNRLNFLQHSYTLSQNAVRYYESLVAGVNRFPALPSPTVVVQTGGTLDSRTFTATNSPRLIQGDRNTLSDSSVDIGVTLSERMERVAELDAVLQHLDPAIGGSPPAAKASRDLNKVKDELLEQAEPDRSAIRRWLEGSRDALKAAALGADVNRAMQALLQLFGVTLP